MAVDVQQSGNVSRRRFLGNSLTTVFGVGLFGAALGAYSRQADTLPSWAVRPPGALPEDDFLGACIRCGLCVQDCPYDILKLGGFGDQVPAGTPYFVARTGPCEMCEDIPCIPVCPTNALDHSLKEINDARMGLAVVIDEETCLAFQGLRCEVCFNICPVNGTALTIEYLHNPRSGKHARFIPVVHSDTCTGCGLCERACILDKAAIKVLPDHIAKGELGKHYRFGWKEKERTGESLVTPDLEHHYNLPEGVRYDLQGEGLIIESEQPTPYSDNPLDTLNQKVEQPQ